VRQLMATASGKDGGVLPRDGVIFAHLFGSCEILTVSGTTPPARWSFRQSGKTNVLSGSPDQDGPFGQTPQHRRIEITTIDDDPQDALGVIAHLIQARADMLDQCGSLSAEAFLTAPVVILLPIRIDGVVSGFLGIGAGTAFRRSRRRDWRFFLLLGLGHW